MKIKKKCLVRICFFSKDVLFIIGPIGFNFIILKLKFNFHKKLEKRENLTQ